ncbi:hypothetical protein M2421_000505 [Stenotrophomonas sp. BIGb0135]|nr:hypothetical protein [Stenotrophomonas sp. BIGb0135]
MTLPLHDIATFATCSIHADLPGGRHQYTDTFEAGLRDRRRASDGMESATGRQPGVDVGELDRHDTAPSQLVWMINKPLRAGAVHRGGPIRQTSPEAAENPARCREPTPSLALHRATFAHNLTLSTASAHRRISK